MASTLALSYAAKEPEANGPDTNTIVATWTGLGNAESGTPIKLASYQDKTVQVDGTFGSVAATVVIEGSNDGTTYYTLTDNNAAAITGTAAYFKLIAENPVYIRPTSSGGTGTSVNVTLVAVKS